MRVFEKSFYASFVDQWPRPRACTLPEVDRRHDGESTSGLLHACNNICNLSRASRGKNNKSLVAHAQWQFSIRVFPKYLVLTLTICHASTINFVQKIEATTFGDFFARQTYGRTGKTITLLSDYLHAYVNVKSDKAAGVYVICRTAEKSATPGNEFLKLCRQGHGWEQEWMIDVVVSISWCDVAWLLVRSGELLPAAAIPRNYNDDYSGCCFRREEL